MAMSRQLRKVMRRNAAEIAQHTTRIIYDTQPGGKLVRISDASALAALEKAFTFLFKNGCEPVVFQLSQDAARGFPSYRPDLLKRGYSAWLGVAVDQDDQPCYVMEQIDLPEVDPTTQRRMAEQVALRRLSALCQTSGLTGEWAETLSRPNLS